MEPDDHGQKVIPFFKIQGPRVPSQLKGESPTAKTWLEKEKLMAAILDSMDEGVFTLDFNLIVTSFNRSAERITGFSAKEAIGRHCMEVFCNVGNCDQECIAECPVEKTCKYKTSITKKHTIINKRGATVIVSVTATQLFAADSRPIGAVVIFNDITRLERLKERLEGEKSKLGNIIGKSPPMKEIYHLIDTISETLSNVLIQGETGTGKGLVAATIHNKSANAKGPFVHVNCASMPDTLIESELFGHTKGAFTGAISDRKGKFEKAHKGTLFLDEIGELTPPLQAKLLRVVEDKKFEKVGGSETIGVDVRIISATNKNIEQAISNKRFRKDLFFRLNIIPIKIPPLHERMEDLPLLIDHLIDKLNLKMELNIKGVSSEVFDSFMKYSWPGNVRELDSVLEYALIQCAGNYCSGNFVEHRCLPPSFKIWSKDGQVTDNFISIPPKGEAFRFPKNKPNDLKAIQRKMIAKALQTCNWNRTQTAAYLKISRSTLWRWMKEFKFD